MIERRWVWRVTGTALALLVIGLAVRKLAASWTELIAQPIHWRITPAWLVLSVAIVWAAYAILVEAWRRVVVSLGQRLGYVDAARICMVSNLGKYIPGKVWAIAGNALLAQRAGVAAPAAVAAAVVLQALALASGVVLVGILAPATLRLYGDAYVIGMLLLAAGAVGGVVVLTSAPAIDWLKRLVPRPGLSLVPVPHPTMLAAFVVNGLAWGAYGVAFLSLARGLTPDVSLSWRQATTVFTLSYLVGLVAVFAPAGVGPRESVFILLLAGPLGPKLAVALALATRALLTLTELGAAVPFLVMGKGTRR